MFRRGELYEHSCDLDFPIYLGKLTDNLMHQLVRGYIRAVFLKFVSAVAAAAPGMACSYTGWLHERSCLEAVVR